MYRNDRLLLPLQPGQRHAFTVRHSVRALSGQTDRALDLYQEKYGVNSTVLSIAEFHRTRARSVEVTFKVYSFASITLHPGSGHGLASMLTSDT